MDSSAVYQTVYHDKRDRSPVGDNRFSKQMEKPADLAGLSVEYLVALTGIEPVF